MIFLFLLTLTNVGTTFSRNVNVAVLLPFDDDRLFSLKQIVPAITLAIDEINNRTDFLLNKMTVRYADTKCDIAYGINHAIEFYMKGQVHAFFGPVCDFAVAPVARQVQFWNLPMISGGAMARDFFVYKDTTYGMLTRVGPVNFETLSLMFGKILNHYKWNRLKLLYESSGQDYIVTGFCHLLTEALHYDLLTVHPKIEQDYFRLDEGVDMDYILAREIGHHYSRE
ncbi:hypothetical protein SNE40_007307 [Patella caerulea]|uniref:Receptor ligand binding region domain-containing protein n=1 Tax=Patella caerulea TaxID=87958 RepID=A0AAN8JZH7_PATCE